jgi:hypothetical protein
MSTNTKGGGHGRDGARDLDSVPRVSSADVGCDECCSGGVLRSEARPARWMQKARKWMQLGGEVGQKLRKLRSAGGEIGLPRGSTRRTN